MDFVVLGSRYRRHAKNFTAVLEKRFGFRGLLKYYCFYAYRSKARSLIHTRPGIVIFVTEARDL